MNDIMIVRILGIGAYGPGFNDWPQLTARLADQHSAPSGNPKPEVIPPTERRRAPLPVRLAVEVSSQAVAAAGLDPAALPCVFGSGLGDTETTDYLCRELTTAAMQLSPTKFHNSVHNAPAGYWTVSTGCQQAANSIAAYQATAGVALLEAAAQCQLEQRPVLLTVYDCATHSIYRDLFQCDESFALALVLAPPEGPGPRLRLALGAQARPHRPLENTGLERLYRTNPAARALDLAALLADSAQPAVSLELGPGSSLHIDLERAA